MSNFVRECSLACESACLCHQGNMWSSTLMHQELPQGRFDYVAKCTYYCLWTDFVTTTGVVTQIKRVHRSIKNPCSWFDRV